MESETRSNTAVRFVSLPNSTVLFQTLSPVPEWYAMEAGNHDRSEGRWREYFGGPAEAMCPTRWRKRKWDYSEYMRRPHTFTRFSITSGHHSSRISSINEEPSQQYPSTIPRSPTMARPPFDRLPTGLFTVRLYDNCTITTQQQHRVFLFKVHRDLKIKTSRNSKSEAATQLHHLLLSSPSPALVLYGR